MQTLPVIPVLIHVPHNEEIFCHDSISPTLYSEGNSCQRLDLSNN